MTIPAGMKPGWVRFAVPYTDIFDYGHMIMILSSGPGGVVRDYSTTESATGDGDVIGVCGVSEYFLRGAAYGSSRAQVEPPPLFL